jgi:hypothetical protein
VAREYTERWHHQQQIRDATDGPSLTERRLFAPVLDTFVRALPYTYKNVGAPDGTMVKLVITGDAGGSWWLVRRDARWQLVAEPTDPPAAHIEIDQDRAWRLFTKGITADGAEARLTGDEALGAIALKTVSIIA